MIVFLNTNPKWKIVIGNIMSLDNIDFIRDLSAKRMASAPAGFKRYLYDRIDWRDRLIVVKGARGTGKTTLMLQRMREAMPDPTRALYVSLDHLWFADHPLYDVAEFHALHGGTHLFIDEVHYQRNWQQLLKNVYDDFPELSIVYTGSSLLKLETSGADLSRRQVPYSLAGLSFREYLAFEGVPAPGAASLEDVLGNHAAIAADMAGKGKLLPHFYAYLEHGYYPFYKEVYGGYGRRVEATINQVLENDYPSIEDVSFATIQKIKKMLVILAASAPRTPNMSALYRELETDRNQGLKMLSVLERAELLSLLSSKSATLKNMSRPEKIYCDNPNIMAALVERPDVGCMRETFFANQLKAAGHEIAYPPAGDFLVDGTHLFEVGGRRKSFAQIKDVSDSYLAVDDLEVGYGNRVPLWMFGMLY